MTGIAPGWYKDPADPATQRYWDGEGWVGAALPADAQPPPGPPPAEEVPAPEATPNGLRQARSAEPPGVASAPAAQPSSGPSSGTAEAPPGAPPPGRPSPGLPPGGPPPGVLPGGPPPGGPLPGGPLPGGPPPGVLPPGLPYPPYVYVPPAPPPRPHGFQLATPGARLVARLIDIGVLAVLILLVNGWFIWQYAVEMAPAVESWEQYLTQQTSEVPSQGSARAGYLRIVIVLITVALWLAYEVPSVANTGQTLGKRVLGIRVVRVEEAGPIGFGRSLRRWNTIGLPTLLWPCCGIGFVLQFVDALYLLADRPLMQSLHDKSARTVVVRVDTAAITAAGGARERDDETDKSGGTA